MVDWRGYRRCRPQVLSGRASLRWPVVSPQVLAQSPVARVCGRTEEATDRSWLIVVVRCCAIMASQLRAPGGGWNGQICSVNVVVAISGLRRNRNEVNVLVATSGLRRNRNEGWFMRHGLQLGEFYPSLMVGNKILFPGRCGPYMGWSMTLFQITQYIMKEPILAVIPIRGDFHYAAKNRYYIYEAREDISEILDRANERKAGHHMVILTGFRRHEADGEDYFEFQNSYGRSWCDGGFGYVWAKVILEESVIYMLKDFAI